MREQEAGAHVHTRRNGTGPTQGLGRVVPAFTARQYWTDAGMRGLLCLAALSSIAITVGIVGILVYEASTFFRHVTVREFLTDPLWTPLFAMPRYGILPLVAGTVVTTGVA
jgi:phosphate transport system permease protein